MLLKCPIQQVYEKKRAQFELLLPHNHVLLWFASFRWPMQPLSFQLKRKKIDTFMNMES